MSREAARQSASRNGRYSPAQATVIATLPPPTTGMTGVTQRMVAELSRLGDVRIVNLSEGDAARRRGWKVVRSLRQVGVSLRVLAGGAGRGNIYIALNSGWAVLLDVMLVTAARARGRRVYLHHHSFRFVDNPSPILRALYRVGGDYVVDIVLCERMAAGLDRAYGERDRRVVPNLVVTGGNAGGATARAAGRFRLGHLSNLSVEKGVGRTVNAFAAARAAGHDVELHLAGPFADDRARSIVEQAVGQWPDAVIYHGPVYEARKDAFYASLDLFLYPTAYVVEAQPLVLLEALGAGVPVVSVDRGCVAGLAGFGRGEAVTIAGLDGFSDAVVDEVRRRHGRQTGHEAARAAADAFATEARAAFARITAEILGLPAGEAESGTQSLRT